MTGAGCCLGLDYGAGGMHVDIAGLAWLSGCMQWLELLVNCN